jgi:hypothetical protein
MTDGDHFTHQITLNEGTTALMQPIPSKEDLKITSIS